MLFMFIMNDLIGTLPYILFNVHFDMPLLNFSYFAIWVFVFTWDIETFQMIAIKRSEFNIVSIFCLLIVASYSSDRIIDSFHFITFLHIDR